jgi:hypothetical protein
MTRAGASSYIQDIRRKTYGIGEFRNTEKLHNRQGTAPPFLPFFHDTLCGLCSIEAWRFIARLT